MFIFTKLNLFDITIIVQQAASIFSIITATIGTDNRLIDIWHANISQAAVYKTCQVPQKITINKATVYREVVTIRPNLPKVCLFYTKIKHLGSLSIYGLMPWQNSLSQNEKTYESYKSSSLTETLSIWFEIIGRSSIYLFCFYKCATSMVGVKKGLIFKQISSPRELIPDDKISLLHLEMLCQEQNFQWTRR